MTLTLILAATLFPTSPVHSPGPSSHPNSKSAALTAQDLAFGTVAPSPTTSSSYLGLVPGHSARFVIEGADLSAVFGPVCLGVADGLLASPLPVENGALLIDPESLVVVAQGNLGLNGTLGFDVPIPVGLPVGLPLATQAVVIEPSGIAWPTNALVHETTALVPELVDSFYKSKHPLAGTVSSLVFEDPLSFQDFWSQHLAPTAVAPTVDFERQIAIATFGGWFGTLGWNVRVDAVVPVPGGGVEVQQSIQKCSGGSLPSESKPGAIVVVDRVAGAHPVLTTSQTMTIDCD